MKILVSACLLGRNCKYNGGNNASDAVAEFVKGKEVIPICPEEILGVPRVPMELADGVLINKNGENVDARIRGRIDELLQELDLSRIDCALLKSRSPTCGVKQIYDGTFTGTLVDGMGVLARALQERGCPVIDSEDI